MAELLEDNFSKQRTAWDKSWTSV